MGLSVFPHQFFLIFITSKPKSCFTEIHWVGNFLSLFLHLFMFFFVLIWGSEGNIWELVFCSHHVGPRDQIQIGRLGGKRLYGLSHLTGLSWKLSIKHNCNFNKIYFAALPLTTGSLSGRPSCTPAPGWKHVFLLNAPPVVTACRLTYSSPQSHTLRGLQNKDTIMPGYHSFSVETTRPFVSSRLTSKGVAIIQGS